METFEEFRKAFENVRSWIVTIKATVSYEQHVISEHNGVTLDTSQIQGYFGTALLNKFSDAVIELIWSGKTRWSAYEHNSSIMTAPGMLMAHTEVDIEFPESFETFTDFFSIRVTDYPQVMEFVISDQHVNVVEHIFDEVPNPWAGDPTLVKKVRSPAHALSTPIIILKKGEQIIQEGGRFQKKFQLKNPFISPGSLIHEYEFDFFPSDNEDEFELLNAIHQLQAAAASWAKVMINTAGVRTRYIEKIRHMSDDIWKRAKGKEMSFKEAAEMANAKRNIILQQSREESTAIARAAAEHLKKNGITFKKALDHQVDKMFKGRTFDELNQNEKIVMYKQVIKASGRDRGISKLIPYMQGAGGAFAAFTFGMSAVKVWMAENKVSTALEEGLPLAGGIAGSHALAALGVLVLPPGAVVAGTALFVAGGIAGSIVGELVAQHDWQSDMKYILSGES